MLAVHRGRAGEGTLEDGHGLAVSQYPPTAGLLYVPAGNAAPDFDIIGVRAKTEDFEGPGGPR